MAKPLPEKIQVKAAWISDVHLGYKDCKADYLLQFLDRLDCDVLYLVGDIIDMWSLTKTFYWPDKHNRVIRKLMKMAKKKKCRVIYIPGNHDVNFRDFVGEKFGNVEVHMHYVHTTADQKRLLVMHGDELDSIIRFGRVTQIIGDSAYDFLLFLNRWTNFFRKRFGYGYWSLAAYLKSRVSGAKKAIDKFELAAIDWAKKHDVDGIVCGHIHHPNIRQEDGILYCNDGDWIESCSFMVEHYDGSLEILHWTEWLKQAKIVNLETLNTNIDEELKQTA